MTRTEVSHRIDVDAPADAIYRIVADVTQWPLYFPPTVRAERISGDDTDERIRIWALANGELRVWDSHRVLDPAEYRVRFAQAHPRDLVAEMGGAWTVLPGPDGRSTVVLDHFYRATGDDQEILARITSAVDTNSRSELAHLKQSAEGSVDEQGLLLDFSDSLTVNGSLEAAYDFIYAAGEWPERLPHVVRLTVDEAVAGLQVMEMDTRSPDGSVHTTRSGRVCLPPQRIVYKQTVLPPALRAHSGEWHFEPGADGTVTVTSRHQVILDPDGIAKLPNPPATMAAARQAVQHALGTNSRATMDRLRDFVEAD
ncbi:MAG: cyclase/dehydrase [Glaciihabitans sp.]|nr:cyclase/dehydrase [Glaciihabitans sp.]